MTLQESEFLELQNKILRDEEVTDKEMWLALEKLAENRDGALAATRAARTPVDVDNLFAEMPAEEEAVSATVDPDKPVW